MSGPRLGSIAVACCLGATLALAGGEPIDRFFRIDERVAVGGQPTPSQVAGLRADGFRTLLNLREPSEINPQAEIEAARAAGLRYLAVPMSSAHPTDAAVEEFLNETDDPSIYPVFIHCASANRASALWMVRRVLRDGWTLADAEAEARVAGLTSATLREFARDYVRRHAK